MGQFKASGEHSSFSWDCENSEETMKSKFRTPIVVIVFLVSVRSSFGRDAYVAVSTGQYGHGFFRQFQNECYVFTPKHVVNLPGEITVIASGGDRASAEVF